MVSTKELVQRHEQVVVQLQQAHKTAANLAARRQITAMIKQHQRTIQMLLISNKHRA